MLAALLGALLVVACGGGGSVVKSASSGATSTSTTGATSTASSSTPSTSPSTPSTERPAPRFTLEPYRGLGAWVDVFDWSEEYDRTPQDPPAVGLGEIDDLADRGVRTLYLQFTRFDATEPGIVEPARARSLLSRAQERGMAVVGWYLPTFEDPVADRARIDAVLALPLDGFALDVESVRLADERERNRRAVALAAELRAEHPGAVLGAIVLPPVVTEVYGTYWGSFPWEGLAPSVDVWLPMAYWTNRTVASGWRDAHRYTATNIDLLREVTGRSQAVVHPVGGIACCEGPTAPTTVADVDGFLRAARERGAIGASLYDVATTPDELWEPLAAANDL